MKRDVQSNPIQDSTAVNFTFHFDEENQIQSVSAFSEVVSFGSYIEILHLVTLAYGNNI